MNEGRRHSPREAPVRRKSQPIFSSTSAADNAISKFAREHDYVVVTKDADFRALRLTFGQSASRVVWIRSGNGSTKAIEQALRSRVEAIEAVVADETGIVDIL